MALSACVFVVALWSANSGIAALFDAFNVIYKEKETRSLLALYGTTFLFTLAAIAFLLAAIGAVIVLPLVLTFIGMSTPAERFLSIVRWQTGAVAGVVENEGGVISSLVNKRFRR